MKSVSLLLALGLGVAVVAGSSCGGNPLQANSTPAIDTAAENRRIRDSIGERIAGHAGFPYSQASWILEGGAIDHDGSGTVVTTGIPRATAAMRIAWSSCWEGPPWGVLITR